jgi:hypothetical protein
MSPLDIDTVLAWRGRAVLDRDGEQIGTLDDILLDARTDLPAWGGVRTGLFGRKESYIPLDVVEEADDALRVPFEKRQVTEAPAADPDIAMTPEEEDALFSHYGREQIHGMAAQAPEPAAGGAVSQERSAADSQEQAGAEAEGRAGAQAPEADAVPEADRAPDADAAPAAGSAAEAEMIRSEEEIRTGTTGMRPSERVRLKKVLVTDEVKRTVPVRREEVRLETDPPPEGRIEDVQDVAEGESRSAEDRPAE